MNKFRFLAIAVVLLLLLNIGTLAYLFRTRNDNERPGPPGKAVADFIIRQLQLDAEQQQKFDEIINDVVKMMGQPRPPMGGPGNHPQGPPPGGPDGERPAPPGD